jgi:hypothetical protein
MSYTLEQLREMTVAELREIAAGMKHEAVQGYTQMNKEHIITAICRALNIDTHLHHRKAATGIDKAKIKQQIKRLKQEREGVVGKSDKHQLHEIRRQLHELKHSLRKAATAQK